MINHYDFLYGGGLGLGAPYWLLRGSARRKVLHALRHRMGHDAAALQDERGAEALIQPPPAPCVMIHAVSVGEINATRALIQQLADARPALRFVVSTTTQTGYERGIELYGEHPHVAIIRYPLDFTPAIARVLDGLAPELVVLMELEVWPNFLRQCQRRGIPVVLANGRITEPSFRKYRLLGPVGRRMFRRLALACVQDQVYADRFVELGVPESHVLVAGTMKFDTAVLADRVDGDLDLALECGLDSREEYIWVCGSTGPGEEELILREFRALMQAHGRMRLVIVPRHDTRFDEVAELIRDHRFNVLRRSKVKLTGPSREPLPPVVLGDTMGELRKFYSLANVVFVGRTLVDLGPRQHGSDMIEPAALAKPTIVGPFTHNFASAMLKFRAAEAIMEVPDAESLRMGVAVLHSTRDEARLMGLRAREVVRQQQGATARHAKVILQILDHRAQAAPEAEATQRRTDDATEEKA